jgi:hypothetical protein
MRPVWFRVESVKDTATKPVSYIVKGLRLKNLEDEQRNRLTKRLPAGRQGHLYRYPSTIDLSFLSNLFLLTQIGLKNLRVFLNLLG